MEHSRQNFSESLGFLKKKKQQQQTWALSANQMSTDISQG